MKKNVSLLYHRKKVFHPWLHACFITEEYGRDNIGSNSTAQQYIIWKNNPEKSGWSKPSSRLKLSRSESSEALLRFQEVTLRTPLHQNVLPKDWRRSNGVVRCCLVLWQRNLKKKTAMNSSENLRLVQLIKVVAIQIMDLQLQFWFEGLAAWGCNTSMSSHLVSRFSTCFQVLFEKLSFQVAEGQSLLVSGRDMRQLWTSRV